MARRSSFRLAACLAAAALALVPASAAAAYRAFRSPSGKLGCAFYSDEQNPRTARCDWDGFTDRETRTPMMASTASTAKIHHGVRLVAQPLCRSGTNGGSVWVGEVMSWSTPFTRSSSSG